MRKLLGRSPISNAYVGMTAGDVRVLAYHGVPDAERFDAQVRHLVADYRPIGLDDLHDALHRGRQLPRRAVLVTFDDGDRSIVDNGLPVLSAHSVPAVAYVVTDLLDGSAPTWWREVETLFGRGRRPTECPAPSADALVRALKDVPDQRRRALIDSMRDGSPVVQPQLTSNDLRNLVANGVAVGNHTADHPCLDRCDDAALIEQIRRAHSRLTDMLGTPPNTFAYPNGNPDPRAVTELTALGYRSVFLFDHRLVRLPADPTALSRIRADAGLAPAELSLLVSGLHSAIHHRIPGRL